MSKLHINKMASLYRHVTLLTNINHNLFICILISLLLPSVHEGAKSEPSVDDGGRRLTREYHLRQGALRGLVVKPSRQYDLQAVEMFLGIPYAAPPVGSLRFMPPVSAPPWPGVKLATDFAPVCPQTLPPIKKGNPPSLGRQQYRARLERFLKTESENCLFLNIYVPYREQKTKKFPILVFIHGDSFEYSSGNSYDGKILSSYGNIMVITINYRLGILGFMKPSLTEHTYGNNGLLDQLAALQWIKDNIEDLNGDPRTVTIMGHGTGAACVSFLMLSPISNDLFHRAILMSGSALSDWAMTKNPAQYTLQVAQILDCYPSSKDMMACLQNKSLSEIKKVQLVAPDFETRLGPIVAGSFIPNDPDKIMESFPNLLSKYQLLCGVTEMESYHDFGVIELDHGILENQRDDFIKNYTKTVLGNDDDATLREILKQYAPSKLNPQRWSVESNRDVILNLFSDARTLAPMIKFVSYQSKANRKTYFYVFGHNSVSTDFAALNKSVNGEELPYVLGVPLGNANTHFHSEYTHNEKLLSEIVMRLWTNFVKIGTPNTQSSSGYYTLDKKNWNQFNVEWPEYTIQHQPYLKLAIPPYISSFYRSNSTKFWTETLPSKMKRYFGDPMYEFTSLPSTQRPRIPYKHTEPTRSRLPIETHNYNPPAYGKIRPYVPPVNKPDPETIYREIQAIKTPVRPIPRDLMERPTTTVKSIVATETNQPIKTSAMTVTIIVTLCLLFLAINVAICAVLYFKKRKLQIRERIYESAQNSRAELGDVDIIGQKCQKDDKTALRTLKDGYNVFKSIKIAKVRNSREKSKKDRSEIKTPKSDDSGGFRERFQLRRHLSTSTLDAHAKVRDWIANEMMHRCSPNNIRKSNSDVHTSSKNNSKPYTRSEEILSDKIHKTATLRIDDGVKQSSSQAKRAHRTKMSEKTTSTSALGSHSSIGSNKNSTNSLKNTQKSTDSLKSVNSTLSRKVSVGIDATPAARTRSILSQEPIELTKSLDLTTKSEKHSNTEKLQRSKTEGDVKTDIEIQTDEPDHPNFTSIATLPLSKDKPKISHKHSTSDPVTDVNYDKILKEKKEAETLANLLPPVSFRNDINVTSRDEAIKAQPMSAAEALLTIKRRNFPKVLPDLPKAHKRLSLQPNSLQTFRSYAGGDVPDFRSKIPPQPPPRTTTLERRLAYRNSKSNLSSFDASNVAKIPESCSLNYENIDSLSPPQDKTKQSRSFDSVIVKEIPVVLPKDRQLPKVIIASSEPSNPEPKIIIQPSSSQVNIPSNAPRVRLPEDFHSQTSGSITSFSSFDEDEEDDDDDLFPDDKLLQELVGGVESPTNMDVLLDTKGPDLDIGKKLEIIQVKVNTGAFVPKNREDYVCITDLQLTDVIGFEKTAQIKPNFSLNKLQQRCESINRPPEKAVKVKQRKSIKSGSLLNKSFKSRERNAVDGKNRIEHSNSGSSNDTETSTGTVKKVELKK